MLTPHPDHRITLRQTIESGRLATSGAIGVPGDAVFFERSLIPLEALWPVLHGVDVWPKQVRTLPGSPSDVGIRGWLESAAVARASRALVDRELA